MKSARQRKPKKEFWDFMRPVEIPETKPPNFGVAEFVKGDRVEYVGDRYLLYRGKYLVVAAVDYTWRCLCCLKGDGDFTTWLPMHDTRRIQTQRRK